MSNRWLILAALTFARTVMGFQFQSVAAVAPLVIADFHIGYAALGTVIGLYLLPGVAVAIPGGVLAQRFGDKRMVLFGLAAMTLGGLMMASGDETLLTAGRVLSGCGAVVLNVLLTKMTTDTFEGREVVTALGVLITSWPLGIALALVTLPRLAAAASWHAAMVAGAGLSAVAFVLVAVAYRSRQTSSAAARLRFDLAHGELVLAMLAGLVWTFYNMGLILVLTFGPAWLIAGGDTAAHASAVVSLVSWLILPAIPLGAFLADRAGHPMTTMFSFFALGALAIALLPFVGGAPALLAAIGLIFGPPGGLIMALPGQAAPAQRRAPAMGVYFTVYYVGMGIAPGIAGFARDVSHSAAAPLWLAVAMLACAALSLAVFRAVRRTEAAV
ncbi:MAG TPA: MFS transporter [Pseudolabrys sp.]|uniref:MFS transporter n=1 Tax=Pseudolabrys sp. TaxID=1960880 RepID=UPI002DDD8D60|nr:MFS transporter [Pseudolabrys sp.]HEV2629174.1 MFS transporter [Pseudolabrys sp.]